VLWNNNYVLSQISSGIGNATSFKYLGQDGQLAIRMDSNFPNAHFNREELVHVPYNFEYMREKVYANLSLEGNLQIISLSTLVTEFF